MEKLFSHNDIINIGGFITRASNILGLEFYKWAEKDIDPEIQENIYKIVVLLNSRVHPGKVLFLSKSDLVKFLFNNDYLITGEIETFIDSLDYSFFDVMQSMSTEEEDDEYEEADDYIEDDAF